MGAAQIERRHHLRTSPGPKLFDSLKIKPLLDRYTAVCQQFPSGRYHQGTWVQFSGNYLSEGLGVPWHLIFSTRRSTEELGLALANRPGMKGGGRPFSGGGEVGMTHLGGKPTSRSVVEDEVKFIHHQPAAMLSIIDGLVWPNLRLEVEVIAILPT